MEPNSVQVRMILREPKVHSVRYDAAKDQDDPALTSLYVSKLAFPRGQPAPQEITVTVSW